MMPFHSMNYSVGKNDFIKLQEVAICETLRGMHNNSNFLKVGRHVNVWSCEFIVGNKQRREGCSRLRKNAESIRLFVQVEECHTPSLQNIDKEDCDVVLNVHLPVKQVWSDVMIEKSRRGWVSDTAR